MSNKCLDPEVFEISGPRQARCRVCPDATWTKVSNAQSHTKTQKHLQNLTAQNRTQESKNEDGMDSTQVNDNGFDLSMSEWMWEEDVGEDRCVVFDPLGGTHAQDVEKERQAQVSQMMSEIFQHQSDLGLFPLVREEEFDTNEDDTWTRDQVPDYLNDEFNEVHETTMILEEHIPKTPAEWFPYPSKAMFLTDLLFNSPHLRFSRAQKQAMLKWARDLGARDVPNLHALEAFQKKLTKEMGTPTTERLSRKGNIYYLNEIGAAIAKDIANPLVRPHMNFYPEDANGAMSQIWHGAKWLKDMPDELLTPMVIHPDTGKHFYVQELCLCNGHWYIPQRWFRKKDAGMWSLGVEVSETTAGFVVQRGVRVERPLSQMTETFEDIVMKHGDLKFSECSINYQHKMPSPLRIAAKGRPFFYIPVFVFVDDVSGNISKQWNKHFVCYISNGALPREHVDSEFNVRFMAASPNVGPLELIQGIRESFENAAKPGIPAYDCALNAECIFRPIPYIWPADNPMQADQCSHSGLTSNKFCRTCHAGGTQEFKRSDQGYLSLFECGTIRETEATCTSISEQFERALAPNSRTALEKLVRESGVKDAVAQPIIMSLTQLGTELWSQRGQVSAVAAKSSIHNLLNAELARLKSMGPIQNPLLEMEGVNIHMDTPTEILHTILLGLVKYFWGQTVYLIAKQKKFEIFQARLESVPSDGLNIPRILAGYMCQYRGALIGKHFKTIVQVLPYTIYDLVHEELLNAWLLMGRLTVLCWHTEIINMDFYLVELKDTIQQMLTQTALCAPSIIMTKPKFHFLLHLPFYIQRFGPALLFATERYESFNTVFRLSSVHSNRQAPSRDCALTFAQLDRVKHITTGGWWFSSTLGTYTCASQCILKTILKTKEYSRLLGLDTTPSKIPGTVAMLLPSKVQISQNIKKLPPIEWHKTVAGSHTSLMVLHEPGKLFLQGRSVVAVSTDVAKVGQAVIVQLPQGQRIGFLTEILVPLTEKSNPTVALIVANLLALETNRHPLLDAPQLTRTTEFVVTQPKEIICAVNVQHDCATSHCNITGTQIIRQERRDTDKTKRVIAHNDSDHYLLNIAALHNYKYIIDFLPTSFPQPRRYHVDHRTVRMKMAAQLRDKKRQAQDAKEAREQEVIMGRATIEPALPSHPAAPPTNTTQATPPAIPPLQIPFNLTCPPSTQLNSLIPPFLISNLAGHPHSPSMPLSHYQLPTALHTSMPGNGTDLNYFLPPGSLNHNTTPSTSTLYNSEPVSSSSHVSVMKRTRIQDDADAAPQKRVRRVTESSCH